MLDRLSARGWKLALFSTVWAMPTDPSYDIEMIEIYRRYVQLHHDLLPYMLAHVDEAVTCGVPLARPLVRAGADVPGRP